MLQTDSIKARNFNWTKLHAFDSNIWSIILITLAIDIAKVRVPLMPQLLIYQTIALGNSKNVQNWIGPPLANTFDMNLGFFFQSICRRITRINFDA